MATIQMPGSKRSPSSGGDPIPGLVRKLPVLAAALFVLVFISSSFVYINPGYVGIKIDRMGGGISQKPLEQGLHFRFPLTTTIEEYPVFMQTMVLTREGAEGSPRNDEINVNSVEGQPVSMDASLSFELDKSKVPALYTTFRTDIGTIQQGYVRQTIRQTLQEVVGREEIAAILGPKKAETVGRAQALLSERLAPYGFIVKQFTLNEMRAPAAVMEAINAKNVMQQQALTAQNELQKNMYQAQGDSIKAAGRAKAIMAESQAQAEANRMLAQSITPTLVQYEMTKRWDGKMPQVSGSAVPMIQLPSPR